VILSIQYLLVADRFIIVYQEGLHVLFLTSASILYNNPATGCNTR